MNMKEAVISVFTNPFEVKTLEGALLKTKRCSWKCVVK